MNQTSLINPLLFITSDTRPDPSNLSDTELLNIINYLDLD